MGGGGGAMRSQFGVGGGMKGGNGGGGEGGEFHQDPHQGS